MCPKESARIKRCRLQWPATGSSLPRPCRKRAPRPQTQRERERRNGGWAASLINEWPRRRSGETGKEPYSADRKHTSELQSLMRISYAVFCLKKKNKTHEH